MSFSALTSHPAPFREPIALRGVWAPSLNGPIGPYDCWDDVETLGVSVFSTREEAEEDSARLREEWVALGGSVARVLTPAPILIRANAVYRMRDHFSSLRERGVACGEVGHEEVDLFDILTHLGVDITLDFLTWTWNSRPRELATQLRLFSADCVERALLRERAAGREPHKAAWSAVEAARAYARGEVARAVPLTEAHRAARDADRFSSHTNLQMARAASHSAAVEVSSPLDFDVISVASLARRSLDTGWLEAHDSPVAPRHMWGDFAKYQAKYKNWKKNFDAWSFDRDAAIAMEKKWQADLLYTYLLLIVR